MRREEAGSMEHGAQTDLGDRRSDGRGQQTILVRRGRQSGRTSDSDLLDTQDG